MLYRCFPWCLCKRPINDIRQRLFLFELKQAIYRKISNCFSDMVCWKFCRTAWLLIPQELENKQGPSVLQKMSWLNCLKWKARVRINRNSAGHVTVPMDMEEQSAFGWKKTYWSMGIVYILLCSRKKIKLNLNK